MKTSLLIVGALFCLTACSSGGDDKPATPPTTQEEIVDVTNYSVCDSGPTATSIEGTWKRLGKSPRITLELTMRISRNQVSMMNTCSFEGRQLSASLTARSTYNAQQFTILESLREDEVGYAADGSKFTCSVSSTASNIEYSFHGRCLVIRSMTDGSTSTLVPSY